MKSEQKHFPKPSEARQCAGGVLATNGNRMLLILSSLAVLACGMLYVMIDTANYYFTFVLFGQSPFLNGLCLCFFVLVVLSVTLFFTIPLVYGLFFIAADVIAGKNPVVSDVLRAFSDRETYLYVLRFAFESLWRLALAVGAVWGTFVWAQDRSVQSVGWAFLGALLIAVEIAIYLAWISRRFFMPYLMASEQMPYAEASRRSAEMARENRRCMIRCLLDYLPWLLLSFLTVGILFFADVLPRMLISYSHISQSTHEMIIRSEEMIDHE